MKLMVEVLGIALRLVETVRRRIFEAGNAKAVWMLHEYAKPGGVLSWAPAMKEWLQDPRYIWFLGMIEVNG